MATLPPSCILNIKHPSTLLSTEDKSEGKLLDKIMMSDQYGPPDQLGEADTNNSFIHSFITAQINLDL